MDPLALVLIVAAVTSRRLLDRLAHHEGHVVGRPHLVDRARVYVWIFAIAGIVDGGDAARLILMAVLVTAWGARLTFNFARKGGYTRHGGLPLGRSCAVA